MAMQRRRLLHAIAEIIARQGMEGARVGRICKQAGVSRRTFYELFEDREACLLAAFDQAIERLAQSVRSACSPTATWSGRIRAGLQAALAQMDADPGLARLCVVETLRAGPAVLARRKQLLDTLAAQVDRGRAHARQGQAVPPLTAQGVVGGALSVLHARLLEPDCGAMADLAGPLTAMIVHPYLGPVVARRELERLAEGPPAASSPAAGARHDGDPFRDLSIRFTYRTARVLSTIAAEPGASNRVVAAAAGILDEGQTSRLLRRLQRAGLIENGGESQSRGEPNAWTLTARGWAVQTALGG
jgi:AcrR family transcriptional regulator